MGTDIFLVLILFFHGTYILKTVKGELFINGRPLSVPNEAVQFILDPASSPPACFPEVFSIESHPLHSGHSMWGAHWRSFPEWNWAIKLPQENVVIVYDKTTGTLAFLDSDDGYGIAFTQNSETFAVFATNQKEFLFVNFKDEGYAIVLNKSIKNLKTLSPENFDLDTATLGLREISEILLECSLCRDISYKLEWNLPEDTLILLKHWQEKSILRLVSTIPFDIMENVQLTMDKFVSDVSLGDSSLVFRKFSTLLSLKSFKTKELHYIHWDSFLNKWIFSTGSDSSFGIAMDGTVTQDWEVLGCIYKDIAEISSENIQYSNTATFPNGGSKWKFIIWILSIYVISFA